VKKHGRLYYTPSIFLLYLNLNLILTIIYETPWKARTPAPRRKGFVAVLGLDENLRVEMSLKWYGKIVDW